MRGRAYSALTVVCAICWLHPDRLERKMSISCVSLFVCVCKSECLVNLESAVFPRVLSQKHTLKIKAMGIFFSQMISFETEYASFMT